VNHTKDAKNKKKAVLRAALEKDFPNMSDNDFAKATEELEARRFVDGEAGARLAPAATCAEKVLGMQATHAEEDAKRANGVKKRRLCDD
jgi:hypothetical protein